MSNSYLEQEVRTRDIFFHHWCTLKIFSNFKTAKEKNQLRMISHNKLKRTLVKTRSNKGQVLNSPQRTPKFEEKSQLNERTKVSVREKKTREEEGKALRKKKKKKKPFRGRRVRNEGEEAAAELWAETAEGEAGRKVYLAAEQLQLRSSSHLCFSCPWWECTALQSFCFDFSNFGLTIFFASIWAYPKWAGPRAR